MVDRVSENGPIKPTVMPTNSTAPPYKKHKAAADGKQKSRRAQGGSSGADGAPASTITSDVRAWGTPRPRHDWWRGLASTNINYKPRALDTPPFLPGDVWTSLAATNPATTTTATRTTATFQFNGGGEGGISSTSVFAPSCRI